MLIVVVVLGALLVTAVVALVVLMRGHVSQPGPWLERVLKKKILIHQKGSPSIEGVLMEHTLDGVILRAAVLLGDDKSRTAMAGETFVPRENIAFAQLDE